MEVILNPIVIIVFVVLIILLFIRDQKIASLKLENFNIQLINDQLTGQVVDLKQQIKEHTLSGEIYNEMADPRTRINLGQQTEPDELALEEQHPETAPTRLPTAEELRAMPVTRGLQIEPVPAGPDDEKTCVCNVGVQECELHPGRLYTEEEKSQFGQDWNARVDAGKN